jgi:predicted Zn-dependent protease
VVAGLAFLGHRQVMIWRNTDTLFRYIEQQPAFTWNASQQAYVYQLWAAHAQENGRTEEARAKNILARRTLQEGALEAAGHGAWAEAVERARLLEQSYGLPPVLRRERARWLLALDRFEEAGVDLRRVDRELPGDAETAALLAEWARRRPASAGGNLL